MAIKMRSGCYTCLLVGVGYLLLGGGCVTSQAPKSSQTMWTPAKGQTFDFSDTWSAAQKQKVSLKGPVGPADLVDYALQNSPVLQVAWQTAKQSEAQAKQAEGAYYPTVNVGGNYKVGKSDNNLINEDSNVSMYGPEADLSWLLLDLGGRGARVRAAANQLLASNYSFNQQFQDLLRDVQTAYYSLYSAESSVKAAESDVEAAEKTLESTKQREAAGLGIHLDVLQAQTDYENSRYNLEEAHAQVQTGRGSLAQVIGLPADAPLAIAEPSAALPTMDALTAAGISDMISEALTRRADVAALRAGVLAYENSVKASESDLWPTLSAGANADKTWTRYSEDNLTDSDTYTYLGYVALSWNVFDGFLTLNEKKAAEAELEAAREQLRNTELGVSADVWSKYFALQSSIKKLTFAKASLASAEEAYNQALDSYNAGLKDIVFLLNSQSQLSTARSTLVATENENYTSYINLAHAMGTLSTTTLSK